MIGRKTLSEVRAELEAALGSGPTGDSEVAESLRRFLAAERKATGARSKRLRPAGGGSSASAASQASGDRKSGDR